MGRSVVDGTVGFYSPIHVLETALKNIPLCIWSYSGLTFVQPTFQPIIYTLYS